MKLGDYSCLCGSDRCYTCHRREVTLKHEAKKRSLGLKRNDRLGPTRDARKTNQPR